DPTLFGTDGIGGGTYHTSLVFNFQKLLYLLDEHYINLYLNLAFTVQSKVKIRGKSVFGGTIDTHGYVSPGNSFGIDLAGEYSMTQNWVALLESFIVLQNKTTFNGVLEPDSKSTFAVKRGRSIFTNGTISIVKGSIAEFT